MTVDPARTGGADVRVVVEAKDRAMSVAVDPRGAARGEGEPGGGRRARRSSARPTRRPASPRSTSVPATSTASIDPAEPDPATLEAAVRLARLLAIASLREVEAEIDVEAIRAALGGVRAELEALKGIKATLTSIAKSASRSRSRSTRSATRSSPASPRPRRRSAPQRRRELGARTAAKRERRRVG